MLVAALLAGSTAQAQTQAQTQVQTPPAAPSPGASPPSAEGVGKGAYLQQLLSYVEWPGAAFATPDAPLVVGVVGAEPVGAELQRLATTRQSSARPLQVRRLGAGDALEGLHAVFIGADAEASRRDWLDRLRDRPVLVVTERGSGLPPGAMLNLVTAQGRQRFEASPETAERVGLKLSSRLLAVAERIVPAP